MMRRLTPALFALLLVGLCPTIARAQVAVTQVEVTVSGSPFSGDGIDALTFDASVAAGSLVCTGFSVTHSSRSVDSVTDDGGNTYAIASQGGTDATAEIASVAEVWIYCSTTTSTMQTVTVDLSSAIASPSFFFLIEFDGQHATTPIEDVAVATPGNGTTHTSGTVTTASSGSALLGIIYGTTGNYDPDADFTVIGEQTEGLAGYDLVGAGSFTMETTTAASENAAIAIIAIAPAAAGGSAPKNLLLMGVGP